MNRRLAFLLVALTACGPTSNVPIQTDLGTYHHPISSRRAQPYFDQGLRLTYAFNHAEAIKSFEAGATVDPNCAICWWGAALAYGPNINAPMDSAAAVAAYAALQKAVALENHASESERAYIDALKPRYGANPTEGRAAHDSAFATAMAALAARYPDDNDAATIAADAGMELRPWNYWQPDGSPYPGVPEIITRLEGAIARDSLHPGACHFYIHIVEASRQPERALSCARHLENAMPGAGHLVHMPGHVYLRLGMYADAERVNVHAAHSDEMFMEGHHEPGFYAMAYYPHNLHFLWASAAFQGQEPQADSAMRRLLAAVPNEAVAQAPFLETVRLAWYYHLAWFEQWDVALADSAPPAAWTTSTGLWHYVRGRAYAARGGMREAAAQLDSLRAIQRTASRLPPAVVVGFASPATLLGIATDVLAGDIAARSGRTAEAVRILEGAVRQEDALTYDEPADWYPSVRLTLGRVLLDAGRRAAARAVYQEELRRHPNGAQATRALARTVD